MSKHHNSKGKVNLKVNQLRKRNINQKNQKLFRITLNNSNNNNNHHNNNRGNH